MADLRLDEVGYWTEVKLSILRDYSAAYAQILSKQAAIRHYAYIDGFAGAGTHISESTGQEIPGSPVVALGIPFSHYHIIELDAARAGRLREQTRGRQDVTVYEGDCNRILLEQVFPQCRYQDYRRALCLLDPYQLNPNWEVVQTAGRMKSIEIFLNFMIMDAKMNVLWDSPARVPPAQMERMNTFWGDDSWRRVAYTVQPGLFGPVEEPVARRTLAVVQAYGRRLREVAGFRFVPDPMPMRNSKGAVIYYLFFASHNATGDKIARAIFGKYRERGAGNGR